MSALTDLFTSLANKIRSKLGTSTTYTPSQAISAIDDVYDKGLADGATPTQEKTTTAGTSATTVTPDSGYALSKVTVNPTPSEAKSASPSTSAQTISPTSGKLLSSVSISAISPQRTAGTAATTAGRDTSGPYVYFPYGWWPSVHATYGCYTRLTNAQAKTLPPTQTKSTTSSRSAQTISPDTDYLLSSVSIAKYPDASGTYTYPANSTGATYDMGATNNLRYVNASNVYAKGKADGTGYSTTITWNSVTTNATKTVSLTGYSNYKNITASNIKVGITSTTSYMNWQTIGQSISVQSYTASNGSLVLKATNSSGDEWYANWTVLICVV